MKMIKRILLMLLLLTGSCFAGEFSVAGIFTDGVILQQKMKVPVWGNAAAGETVKVTFGKQEKTATADETGRWLLRLDPMKASAEPRTLVVSSPILNVQFSVLNVLVGEVWLVGGQSNADFTLAKLMANSSTPEIEPVLQYLRNEVATANDPLLRQFANDGGASPLIEVTKLNSKSGWVPAVKGKVNDFSGTGYFFGRYLREQLGVPVGLIDANRGGTDIEPWIPKRQYMKTDAGKAFYNERVAVLNVDNSDFIKKLAEWKKLVTAAKAAKQRPPRRPSDPRNPTRIPAALFNSHIYALAPYALKGSIWYQGENNTSYRTEQYRDSMLALIEGWREHWGQKKFYFYWCQLASKNSVNNVPNDGDSWVKIQNQQREVLALTSETGMAVLNDIGEAQNIHPNNKVDVGKRLALWALKQAYDQDLVCSGPLYESSKIKGKRVVVTFKHVGSGLMVGNKHLMEPTREVDQPLKRFQICGADRVWKWAEAKIVGTDRVEVWHTDIPEPVEVRYAWSSNPEGANLYNKEGLPASLFKTK